MRPQPARALALIALALAIAGCNRDADRTAAPPPPPPAAGTEVTRAEFSQLRWLEGTWKVSPDSGAQATVFERYTFPDDSTLLVEVFPDASLALVFETRRFVLREGRLVNPIEGASWVAVSLDSGAVRFDPQQGARNSFTWQPVSPDSGRAVRIYPATRRRPAREQLFNMVRQNH
jgi:hypothetical protein